MILRYLHDLLLTTALVATTGLLLAPAPVGEPDPWAHPETHKRIANVPATRIKTPVEAPQSR